MVHAGQRLGRYVLGSRLGAGGMGEVFEAEDTTLGRRVALKVLNGPSLDAASIEQFLVEARAVARLSHPNILAIHDFGTADGTPFAVMERLEGRTLRALLDAGPPDLATAVDYAGQIARGLAAAHAKGIAHRDLKPENVFITSDGQAKVLDFGIATLHDVPLGATVAGGGGPARATAPLHVDAPARGTVGYLSPEQARGLPADHRSDVFSFGAVLYELLTGTRAFDADTAIDALHAVLYRDLPPVARVRPGVPAALERIVGRCLARDPARRYQSTVDLVTDLDDVERSLPAVGAEAARPRTRWTTAAIGGGVALLAVLAVAIVSVLKTPPGFGAKDTLLIADVANHTRDPVFDGTLKQGLEVQLAQSPFLNLVAPADVANALALMGRRRDEPVTAEIARDICLRNGTKAYVTGSITPMGESYVIGLEAVAAADGSVIAREQVQADRKEDVLRELGNAARSLRRTLGESLPSIERFDAPIEQATTASLDALRAYGAGVELTNHGRYQDALASYRRATEIDPDFALAWQALARGQYNISFSPDIEAAATRAFHLRARTTESERLRISSFYHLVVTRNVLKAIEIAELWRQTYPNRWQPHLALSDLYFTVGRFDEGIAAAREAIRLNPTVGPAYSNLAGSLILQNRFAEARNVYEEAHRHRLDAPEFHFYRFWIDRWLDDEADRGRQVEWFAQHALPHVSVMLQSQAAGFEGRWRESRRLTLRAIALADQSGQPAAGTQLAVFDAPNAAAMEDCASSRALAARASTSIWPHERAQTALALALCGDPRSATSTVDRLTSESPEDTMLQSVWAPCVRAAVALADDRATDALKELERTEAFGAVTMWPAWLRGRALLRLGDHGRAVAVFRSLKDDRGRYSWTSPLYPSAHLWLARAAAGAGDVSLARQEYASLLAVWKNADADLRLLVEARRELARLDRP
jgi:eukaryotic-like serine/threonine-protein kinase